jgi:hypothetical protein
MSAPWFPVGQAGPIIGSFGRPWFLNSSSDMTTKLQLDEEDKEWEVTLSQRSTPTLAHKFAAHGHGRFSVIGASFKRKQFKCP